VAPATHEYWERHLSRRSSLVFGADDIFMGSLMASWGRSIHTVGPATSRRGLSSKCYEVLVFAGRRCITKNAFFYLRTAASLITAHRSHPALSGFEKVTKKSGTVPP
jgi:hypothetical protein